MAAAAAAVTRKEEGRWVDVGVMKSGEGTHARFHKEGRFRRGGNRSFLEPQLRRERSAPVFKDGDTRVPTF